MGKNVCSPSICYNDRNRYKLMIAFHTLDLLLFIIRLCLLIYDLSQNYADTIGYTIAAFVLELVGSIPIIICNVVYITLRFCLKSKYRRANPYNRLWHFGTMTCIRWKYQYQYPQIILFLRILILIVEYTFRFISFLVGVIAFARFSPQSGAYAIMAAVSLILSILILIIELIHYFRLWKYNPTRTNDTDHDNKDPYINETHPSHLGFVHHSLFYHSYRQRVSCEEGIHCQSNNLYHYLLYHSLDSEYYFNSRALRSHQRASFIVFHETTKNEALKIVQQGFPYSIDKKTGYPYLSKKITFTRVCYSTYSQAIFCVRVNLGRIITVKTDDDPNLADFFKSTKQKSDSIFVEKTGRFYLRMADQIEQWIVVMNSNVTVNDDLDANLYRPCY